MWAERERERKNGEAGASRVGSGVQRRKFVCWWRICWSTGNSTRGRVSIRFGTYTIRNGRNKVLELALREMAQANMGLGIF